MTRVPPFRERDLSRLRARLEADSQQVDGPSTAALVAPGGLTTGSDLLACVVDAIDHHGAETVATALAGIDRTVESGWRGERELRPPGPVGQAIDLWAAGRADVDFYRGLAHGSTSPDLFDGLPHSRNHPGRLVFLHTVETLLRAADGGAVVLSTPTHSSGTLDVPTLLARMDDSLDAGPLDLLLALLRLQPYDGRPRAVPELSFRPDLSPSTAEAGNAAALVERWLAAGGLPEPEAHVDDYLWRLQWRPPVPWSEFAAVASGGPTGDWDATDWRARVCPRWPDVVTTGTKDHNGDLRAVLALDGPLGAPSILVLLTTLASDRGERYWNPGETDHDVLVDALWSGRIDAGRAAAAAVQGWENGIFSLPDGLPHWRRLLEDGAMAPFWPVALAIAEAGIAHAPKPRGLADLLRLLADLAPEVPAGRRGVPCGVARFAAESGRTKSHDEARRLVTVLARETP